MKPKPKPFLKLTDALIKTSLLEFPTYGRIMRPPKAGNLIVWSENSFIIKIGKDTYRPPNSTGKYTEFRFDFNRFKAGDLIEISEPKKGRHLKAKMKFSYSTGEAQELEFCSKIDLGNGYRGCRFIVPLSPQFEYTKTAVNKYLLSTPTCLACQDCPESDDEIKSVVKAKKETESPATGDEITDWDIAIRRDVNSYNTSTDTSTYSYTDTTLISSGSFTDSILWRTPPYIECSGEMLTNNSPITTENEFFGVIVRGKIGDFANVAFEYCSYMTYYDVSTDSLGHCSYTAEDGSTECDNWISIELVIDESDVILELDDGTVFAGFNATADINGNGYGDYWIVENTVVIGTNEDYGLPTPDQNTTNIIYPNM